MIFDIKVVPQKQHRIYIVFTWIERRIIIINIIIIYALLWTTRDVRRAQQRKRV